MDKILYFGYIVLTSIKHRKKLISFSRFYQQKYKRPAFHFILMAYLYYLKYSMHPLDYFYFNVYANPGFNPNEYASTLFMYRFHNLLNDRKHTKYFINKMCFHERFKDLMGHEYLRMEKTNVEKLSEWILQKSPESLIIKKMKSVGGFGVKRIRINILDKMIYIDGIPMHQKFGYLKKFDMVEEFVVQHELIERINPSCLNTIRVTTVLDKNKDINIIGAVIRLGVDSDVDNFHSGGIAVKIDIETGCLRGEGFRLAPSEPEFYKAHPITNIIFDGYQLPHWQMLLKKVYEACLIIPEVRTIGWDIAITEKGVRLIEGNHDWDKIIIEKALKRGIRKDLEKYI